ncbi:MAG TPA: NADH-ubiquinone oxidoreductase-F iron-sulfur binding region domain-containing protein, partial [Gemmatimonadales bacterium]|nr:NADH-ubiquinone oxidoreductase-F iron-sulfur binding region domain-containing protein [Gemmatimonadales bacterium]
ETLSCVPWIMTKGVDWFKAIGPEKGTGPKVFCISGHVVRPGLYEGSMNITLRELIYDLAGGMRPGRTLKAVIPGGSSVPIMTAAEVEDCQLDYEGVAAKGSMLGSGGMIVMDDSTDLVYQIMRLARFYAHESCAQCTQCREGTAWTTRILERMLAGKGRIEDLDLLLDLADNMTGKTICVLSDSCAAPVVSGIKKFRGEFEAYVGGNRKTAVAV